MFSVCWQRVAHLNKAKKNHWLAVGVQRLQPFGQSAPSRVQITAGRNGHNCHFDRPRRGLPWSVQFAVVCVRENSSCTCRGPRISVAYFPGSNGRQWNPRVLHARARSREWSSRLLRQATSKNTRTQQIHAKTSWQVSSTGSSSNAQQTVVRVLI